MTAAPSSAGPGRRAATPWWYRLGVAAAVAATVASRIGWTTSAAHRTYDDGAYLASVDAVAAGGAPFRDVFSSQGPLWLPTLRLADIVGAGAAWAPRLATLAAAVAIVLAAAGIAQRAAGHAAGLVAAGLVATSGALLFTSATLESDSVAAAFAAAAVLAAMTVSPRRVAATVGCLGAAAVAVKSLVVLPPLALAWYVLVRGRGWRAAVRAVAWAAVAGIAVSLPWGLREVWHQYVGFHLTARHHLTPGRNLSIVRTRLWRDDELLVAAGLATAAWSLLRRLRPASRDDRPAPSPPVEGPALAVAVDRHVLLPGLWLAAVLSAVVLAFSSPLQVQHTTLLVLPLALLIAVHRPTALLVLALAVLVLPGQADRTAWRVSPPQASAEQAAMVTALEGLEPSSARILIDEPGLAWQAGRLIPGDLVDPSYVRIQAGMLPVDDVVDAAEGPDVCLVVFWSGRFATVPGLADRLTGYELVGREGAHLVYLRAGCRLTAGAGVGADATRTATPP